MKRRQRPTNSGEGGNQRLGFLITAVSLRSSGPRLLWAATAAVLAIGIFATSALASDTPTVGGGDCWQTGTPTLCRATWAGVSTAIYFRAIDQFSGSAPTWSTPAQSAVNSWNTAPGPQYYSFTAHANDTWVYLDYSSTGQHDLTQYDFGVTWNCNVQSYCTDTFTAMNILWTDVYLNNNVISSSTEAQETVAHESGHAMGLAHGSLGSVMYPANQSPPVVSPQSTDIGSYPGCSTGQSGVRCIYGDGD